MIQTVQLVTAVFALCLGAIRLVESINELRKTPELNTIGKVWQVVKNFFTVERYV